MGDEVTPVITPELAEAVTRLGHLRRQLKDLETEETLLREQILAVLDHWPKSTFPLRVGAFEVRLGERKGRIDTSSCLNLLETQHLLPEIPVEPVIVNPHDVDQLGRSLVRLAMPDQTREQLVQTYKAAIDFKPVISHDVLEDLYDRARLSPEEYRSCFKDGKVSVVTLTVR